MLQCRALISRALRRRQQKVAQRQSMVWPSAWILVSFYVWKVLFQRFSILAFLYSVSMFSKPFVFSQNMHSESNMMMLSLTWHTSASEFILPLVFVPYLKFGKPGVGQLLKPKERRKCILEGCSRFLEISCQRSKSVQWPLYLPRFEAAVAVAAKHGSWAEMCWAGAMDSFQWSSFKLLPVLGELHWQLVSWRAWRAQSFQELCEQVQNGEQNILPLLSFFFKELTGAVMIWELTSTPLYGFCFTFQT